MTTRAETLKSQIAAAIDAEAERINAGTRVKQEARIVLRIFEPDCYVHITIAEPKPQQ